MKSIQEIEKKQIKEFFILIIVAFILVSLLLMSHYIKRNETIDIYIPFILVAVLLFIIGAIFNLYRVIKIKKNPILKQELNNIILNVSANYFLTDNYIVPYYSNKIIKYDDIILIYYKNNLETHGYKKYMHVVQKNGNVQRFEIDTTAITLGYDSERKDFADILLQKNPNILVGLSEENKKIILEKYGIKK